MLILGLVLAFVLAPAAVPAASSQPNAPAARLSGRVIDAGTGAPISSARVLLVSQPRHVAGPVPQVLTDHEGRYVFDTVAPGQYRVDVQKSGILPPAEPAQVPNVTLSAGQIVDDWDVSVRKGGAIAGRILDPFGEPLVDVGVRATQRGVDAAPARAMASSQAMLHGMVAIDLRAQGITTNDLGEFRLFGLAPGEYILTATPQPRFGNQHGSADAAIAAATFYPGVPDAAAAQTITVTAGETVGGIEFRLETTAGFKVSGVIVDQAGAPVTGAMVMLRGDPRSPVAIMGPVGQTSSDANGRFVLGNVPSGSYYATVIPIVVSTLTASNGAGNFTASGGLQAPRSEPVAVTVADADVEGVTIVASSQTRR